MYANLTCRLLLIGVFLAATRKLYRRQALDGLADTVRRVPVGPAALARPVVGVVAGAEVAVVVLLLVPQGVRFGFALAGMLLGAFLIGTAVIVRRGERVSCNCFGRSTSPLGSAHLWRNGLLLLCAVIGLVTPTGGHLEIAGVVASAVAGVAGTFLIVFFPDYVSLLAAHTPGDPGDQRRRKVP